MPYQLARRVGAAPEVERRAGTDAEPSAAVAGGEYGRIRMNVESPRIECVEGDGALQIAYVTEAAAGAGHRIVVGHGQIGRERRLAGQDQSAAGDEQVERARRVVGQLLIRGRI